MFCGLSAWDSSSVLRTTAKIARSLGAAIVAAAILLILHAFDFYPERLLAYQVLHFMASEAMDKALKWGAVALFASLGVVAYVIWRKRHTLNTIGRFITAGTALLASPPSNDPEWARWQTEFNSWRDGWNQWIRKEYSDYEADLILNIGAFHIRDFRNSYNDLHNRMQNIVAIYVQRLGGFLKEKKNKNAPR